MTQQVMSSFFLSSLEVQGRRFDAWNYAVLQQRWTAAACPLPHAGPSSESFSTLHAAKFSSAASPEISGKPGAPGAATDEATVVSSEEKAEPIQPPNVSNDKGGTGQLVV